MIDYIAFRNSIHKDKPNLSTCKKFSSKWNNLGIETYHLEGCNKLEIHWNPGQGVIDILGSLPYFFKGHNFSFNRNEYVESIELLQTILQVGIWDADVYELEYGTIFKVDDSPELFIRNHTARPSSKLKENYLGKHKGRFKWWDNKNVKIKMYDAGANIKMKQDLKRREAIESDGYNPDDRYLKFEIHHNKPHFLNHSRYLSVEDLQSPQMINHLNQFLLLQYHLLSPMRELQKPICKKELKAIDIVIREFVKTMMNEGRSIDYAKKLIYQSIRESECLESTDKDSRKKTIRQSFNRLREADSSQWDLTEKIEKALEAEL